MKPILIDEFIKDANSMSSGTSVTVDGKVYNGYQIAKPLNYDPDFFPMKDRQEMADAVLQGKAIAVRYFCDLSEEEQVEYVKSKIPKPSNPSSMTFKPPKSFRADGEYDEPNHGTPIKKYDDNQDQIPGFAI
jgi:hypothetical protein